MGKPAARITDMHTCPMATPGTPPIPHVGGPVIGPGCPTVLIGGMPAAVSGDMCMCVGPPDTITLGSSGVFIGGKPSARMGDQCAHGGAIMAGCPTVLIGETGGEGATVTGEESIASGISGAGNSGNGAGSNPGPGKTVEKTPVDKIAFILLDQEGNPVKNENYEVELPGGARQKGKTNDKGEVEISGVPAGECKVSFPDIHAEEWS